MALVLIAFTIFIAMATVSAQDVNETNQVTQVDEIEIDDDVGLADEDAAPVGDAAPVKVSFEKISDSTYLIGESFEVKLVDENGTGIAKAPVQFKINTKTSNKTTDKSGVARIPIKIAKGTYTISYTFEKEGYAKAEGSSKMLILSNSTSQIKASPYVAYVGFENLYSVTLTAEGIPLAGRTVAFKINGHKSYAKTNSKGVATIDIQENAGKYYLYYLYSGEKNIDSAGGKAYILIKKGMSTYMSKANSVVYRDRTLGQFKVKIIDARLNLLSNKKVIFTFRGVKYTKTTDKNGIATLDIKLKKGSYKLNVKFPKDALYNGVSKTYTIKVKAKAAQNNGFWLISTDMPKINFKTLQKYGNKHIFLNAKAFERYGQSYVEKFIKNAANHGIKVHIWMQVFYYNDGWKYPVKNGKYNYDLINSKIKEAKKYAKVKGVAGIHFDYLRFPGNAYQYSKGTEAINYFTKQASNAIHKINSKLIVSAAVMPEPSAMITYYGQDIPTMSKYLDAIIPMVYKGNYHASTSWIKSVTQTFAKQSKGAQIWTGLQTYKSDEDVTKLSAKELMKDAQAAVAGGAKGVILFRYDLFNYINFNDL